MEGLVTQEASAMTADAVEFCSTLIRFDTSNFGGGDSRGERAAAEWVAAVLTDAGHTPVVLESAPGRANTVVRIPGTNPDAPALLVGVGWLGAGGVAYHAGRPAAEDRPAGPADGYRRRVLTTRVAVRAIATN